MAARNLPPRLHGQIPAYDPHRDTQWTRNYKAILHWLDGGEVQIQADGQWVRPQDKGRINFFHLYPARPAGYTPGVSP